MLSVKGSPPRYLCEVRGTRVHQEKPRSFREVAYLQALLLQMTCLLGLAFWEAQIAECAT